MAKVVKWFLHKRVKEGSVLDYVIRNGVFAVDDAKHIEILKKEPHTFVEISEEKAKGAISEGEAIKKFMEKKIEAVNIKDIKAEEPIFDDEPVVEDKVVEDLKGSISEDDFIDAILGDDKKEKPEAENEIAENAEEKIEEEIETKIEDSVEEKTEIEDENEEVVEEEVKVVKKKRGRPSKKKIVEE